MGTCFVIQPFDGGKFDKRYHDVYRPAIEAAGLEPYRVDADASASIPISEIENGIKNAEVCFADITLDNPNVWFELGYALASLKEICLICSEERVGKFPFDVQHRQIIRYTVESSSDYSSLARKITARIAAIQQKVSNLAVIETNSPINEHSDLSQHEMIVLATIMENLDGPEAVINHNYIKAQMKRAGYNNLALNIGINRLLNRHMIDFREESDGDYGKHTVYSISSSGSDWLVKNYAMLNLQYPINKSQTSTIPWTGIDEDIPF